MRLGPKKPTSALETVIRWRQWRRLEAFPGVMNWRSVGSEVEMMNSLSPADRRQRIYNSQKTVFRLRLKNSWTGSIIFS